MSCDLHGARTGWSLNGFGVEIFPADAFSMGHVNFTYASWLLKVKYIGELCHSLFLQQGRKSLDWCHPTALSID
jgi:hypothetical protein